MIDRDERRAELLRERSLTALVILELLLIFVAGPMVATGVTGSRVAVLALSLLVSAAGAIAVSQDRAAAVAILAATLASMAVALAGPHPRTPLSIVLENGGRIVALLVLTWVVGRAVFAPGRVTLHRIRGAVAIYLQIGMIFAFGYSLLLAWHPAAFAPPLETSLAGNHRLLYFSFTTLTSVGFGDIAPAHPVAQSITGLESIIGQLFPATILARLVTLELESRRR